jgi:hypothetical protein
MKKAVAVFRKILPFVLLAVLILLAAQVVYGRAGGGGGSGGGGGDDDSGIVDVVFDIIELMFQYPLVGCIVAVVFILGFFFSKPRRPD